MNVQKRDGRLEPVSFDKILTRLSILAKEFDLRVKSKECNVGVDVIAIAQKVVNGLYDGVKTTELDELAAETAAALSSRHPDYESLAAVITISNHQKETPNTFSEAAECVYTDGVLSNDIIQVIRAHKDEYDSLIQPKRDYDISYFGFRVMLKSYLLKSKTGRMLETPQYMYMRVAVQLHGDDMDKVKETYDMMSTQKFTHASPTLFNAGMKRPGLASCFLVAMKDDSIEGIYDTLKECALISKHAGGIGIHVHNVRSTGAYIHGNNGHSNGIVPMLQNFNATARYVNQGSRRKGSFAIYLEPWHPDVMAFLELKKPSGKEELRARDLFYALWIPDLFMQRVAEDGPWSLFSPDTAPNLHECYGDEFKALYEQYEAEGRAREVIKARDVWFAILESQVESGVPYMLYKDACNTKSNQKNLGVIKSSNLCCEIVEYSAPDETAVCNLASINLTACVKDKDGHKYFDFEELRQTTKVVTRNLNRVIDCTFYPTPAAQKSNMRHRPIGIGVQGLQNVFFLMRMPFDSHAARKLNKDIFEHIYFAALETSCELAQQFGPYETFAGSPASQGILQFDMWAEHTKDCAVPACDLPWGALKKDIQAHGLRNSLLVAPMPTASTAQMLGNVECFEPQTSNLYVRRVLAGDFYMVNKYLIEDLLSMGMWSESMKNKILMHKGSIQSIEEIPYELRCLYKTVWELSMSHVIDMAADRAVFIDQSQSLNLFVAEPQFDKLTSMHFYAWRKGLKTGIYYLRSKPAAHAIQFTLEPQQGGECVMCSG